MAHERSVKQESGPSRTKLRSLSIAPRRQKEPSAASVALSEPGPICKPAPIMCEPTDPKEALPIWLAVLVAASCQARSDSSRHDVSWNCVAGRAVYTNFGREAERIEPLGVSLPKGQTLAVYWTPGETAYTLEVYSQTEKCA